MTKLQIEGTFISYSLLEINKVDALYFDFIIKNNPNFNGKIPIEYLDIQTLARQPVDSRFSGFLSTESRLLNEVGIFTLYSRKKKVFKCTLDRLEKRYHHGLFEELCVVNSSIKNVKLKFRKRSGHKYFLLKEEQMGIFNVILTGEVTMKELHFQQTVIENNYRKDQFLNIKMNDSIIEFPLGGNPEIKKSLEVIS
jgi:hypothetical protein